MVVGGRGGGGGDGSEALKFGVEVHVAHHRRLIRRRCGYVPYVVLGTGIACWGSDFEDAPLPGVDLGFEGSGKGISSVGRQLGAIALRGAGDQLNGQRRAGWYLEAVLS